MKKFRWIVVGMGVLAVCCWAALFGYVEYTGGKTDFDVVFALLQAAGVTSVLFVVGMVVVMVYYVVAFFRWDGLLQKGGER
ncbi:MAG: hypothetical protein AAB581_02640 [Patescibacteria group bacterium]